jgi:flavin reductase (DIM6/NTAB) family NADH-FMN oxidoreductase RutF
MTTPGSLPRVHPEPVLPEELAEELPAELPIRLPTGLPIERPTVLPTQRPTGLHAEAVTVEAFAQALRRFATGVTVVTCTVDSEDHAMTANAFTSVSLEPPLVLVCVEKVTRFHAAVLTAGTWGVSVLDESARQAATWFATRGRPLERQFARFPHTRGEHTGAPLLIGALSTLECRTRATYDGGDHTIVVGDVLSVATAQPDRGPLLYYEGGYHGLQRST